MTEKMVEALKPGGRLVFVEFRLEDAKVPIKLVHKMSERQVLKEMGAFPEMEHTKTVGTLPWQHVIIFTKKEAEEVIAFVLLALRSRRPARTAHGREGRAGCGSRRRSSAGPTAGSAPMARSRCRFRTRGRCGSSATPGSARSATGNASDGTMVNNTVGVQEGNGADAKVTFAIQKDEDGKHTAIFAPPDGKGWFWLFARPSRRRQAARLPAANGEDTAPAARSASRGSICGSARCRTRVDEPTKWKIEYAKVPFAEFGKAPQAVVRLGGAAVEKYVYIYGYEEKPGKPFPTRKLLVARAPADKLADFDSWRFYSNGEWKADVKDATTQIDGLGTEFSVSYLPGLEAVRAGHHRERPLGPHRRPLRDRRRKARGRNRCCSTPAPR